MVISGFICVQLRLSARNKKPNKGQRNKNNNNKDNSVLFILLEGEFRLESKNRCRATERFHQTIPIICYFVVK